MQNGLSLVSFSFDDFPRSALFTGGNILVDNGVRATFYASFGLLGKTAPTGEIFVPDDLEELNRQGHELGCHTFHHCHAWQTRGSDFEASIIANQRALTQYLPGRDFRTFSYPIGWPRPTNKYVTQKYFQTCRGGGQEFNLGGIDLNLLQAFFLERSRDCFSEIARVIDDNARQNGWLIFATHDVTSAPTKFGCEPTLLERVVKHVKKVESIILPVSEAFSRLAGG